MAAIYSINVLGGVSILLGNGDGTFQPAIYDPVEPADILVAGDFNGDGKLDLAIASSHRASGISSDDFALLIGQWRRDVSAPRHSRREAIPVRREPSCCDDGRGLQRQRPARPGRPG